MCMYIEIMVPVQFQPRHTLKCVDTVCIVFYFQCCMLARTQTCAVTYVRMFKQNGFCSDCQICRRRKTGTVEQTPQHLPQVRDTLTDKSSSELRDTRFDQCAGVTKLERPIQKLTHAVSSWSYTTRVYFILIRAAIFRNFRSGENKRFSEFQMKISDQFFFVNITLNISLNVEIMWYSALLRPPLQESFSKTMIMFISIIYSKIFLLFRFKACAKEQIYIHIKR